MFKYFVLLLTLCWNYPAQAQLFYDDANNSVYSSKSPQVSFSNPLYCNDEAWAYLDYQFLDPSNYYKINKARKMLLVLDNIPTELSLTEHNFLDDTFTFRLGLPNPQYDNLKKGYRLKLIFEDLEPLVVTLKNSRAALEKMARKMCCKSEPIQQSE